MGALHRFPERKLVELVWQNSSGRAGWTDQVDCDSDLIPRPEVLCFFDSQPNLHIFTKTGPVSVILAT